MFCKFCGSVIDENSVFCSKCGKSVQINQPVPPVQSVQPVPPVCKNNTRKIVLIVIAAVVALFALSAVVTVAIGVFGYYYWNKAEFDAAEQAEKQLVFEKAMMNKIGTELKGKKIHWITDNDVNDEYFREKVKFLKAASGADVVAISTFMTIDGDFEPIDFKKELAKIPESDVILIDSDVVGNDLMRAKKHRFVFTPNGMGSLRCLKERELQHMFQKGQILFVVRQLDYADPEFEPDEDDLDEAFYERYELIREYDKSKFADIMI